MKIRSNSYELKIRFYKSYEQLIESLRLESMVHSRTGDSGAIRDQFYMPGGKVSLQLRRASQSTFLDVTRTSLFQPKYVDEIVKKFGGEWRESYSKPANNPMSTIDFLVRD